MARHYYRRDPETSNRSKKGGAGKYVLGAAALVGLGLLLWPKTGEPKEPDKKPIPEPDNRKPSNGGVIPPGPRPPSTWGDLSTAVVQTTDPSGGVNVRTSPSVNAPLVTGSSDRNAGAWNGKSVAVLSVVQDADGGRREWWHIYTPGGYEGYASGGDPNVAGDHNFGPVRAPMNPAPIAMSATVQTQTGLLRRNPYARRA